MNIIEQSSVWRGGGGIYYRLAFVPCQGSGQACMHNRFLLIQQVNPRVKPHNEYKPHLQMFKNIYTSLGMQSQRVMRFTIFNSYIHS